MVEGRSAMASLATGCSRSSCEGGARVAGGRLDVPDGGALIAVGEELQVGQHLHPDLPRQLWLKGDLCDAVFVVFPAPPGVGEELVALALARNLSLASDALFLSGCTSSTSRR